MRTASSKLDSVTARKRLAARAAPYFTSIAPKQTLGYVRVDAASAGRWLVQVEIGRGEGGKPVRRRQQLGLADDVAQANGADVLSYKQAYSAALDWAPAEKAAQGALTLRTIVDRYVAGILAAKGERAATGARNVLRFNVLREDRNEQPLPGERGLGDRPVAELTLTELQGWRDSLVKTDTPDDPDAGRRSRSTANRIMKYLKAALNAAFADPANGINSDAAWSKKLRAFSKVDKAREEHFSGEEVLRLIEATRASDAGFADLCEAAFLTGARYGELCALKVRDFNAKRAQLSIPERSSENRCKTGARSVILTREAVEFFERIAADRAPGAPLLSSDGETAWGNGEQQARIKAALAAAELSTDAVFYAFRHSHISRAIENGAPLTLLAKNCGTSVGQIERHYAKVLAQTARDLVQRSMPRLRVVEPIRKAA